MRTTPIPNPLPGPSPRIRSWRVSRASHNAPRPPKPHNLSHEPLLQDTSREALRRSREDVSRGNYGLQSAWRGFEGAVSDVIRFATDDIVPFDHSRDAEM